jgi:transposase
MIFYSGIDLHSRQSTICVIDDKDNIQLRITVPNQIEQILQPLQSFTPFPEVAVEATLNWYWLVDGLQEAGFKVKLAHPFGLQIIKKAKVKTDNRDAFNLARLLRLDALPESYIYPKTKRPIRDLLRRGKGSKQGNPYLKFAFNQAAALAVRYCQPIRKFRQKHLVRKRSRARKLISISIVSHKLAKAAYYILTRKEPFRMEMMFGTYL